MISFSKKKHTPNNQTCRCFALFTCLRNINQIYHCWGQRCGHDFTIIILDRIVINQWNINQTWQQLNASYSSTGNTLPQGEEKLSISSVLALRQSSLKEWQRLMTMLTSQWSQQERHSTANSGESSTLTQGENCCISWQTSFNKTQKY